MNVHTSTGPLRLATSDARSRAGAVIGHDKPCCVADVLLRYYVRPELVSS